MHCVPLQLYRLPAGVGGVGGSVVVLVGLVVVVVFTWQAASHVGVFHLPLGSSTHAPPLQPYSLTVGPHTKANWFGVQA